MENLVREAIIILCICLNYGVAKNISRFSKIKTTTAKVLDSEYDEASIDIVPSNLTAYDLYIPVIKQFEVVIGHPFGFNITFYAGKINILS